MTGLEIAISELTKTLNEGRGIEATEGALFKIIDMIKADQTLKIEFLQMIERSFTNRDPSGLFENGVPRELVELATHELKWPEFAALADKRVQTIFRGDELLAVGDVSLGVKSAYSNSWEDREFFDKYTRQ